MQSQFSLRQILLNSTAFNDNASPGVAAHQVSRNHSAIAESLEVLDIAALA